MIRTFLMISVVSLVSCKQEKVDIGYEVHGTVRGVPDSAMVYLRNDGVNDSTIVIGKKFRFKGKVKEPTWTLMSLENSDEPIPLWLENVKIKIEAVNDRLTEGKVIGGGVQSMANMLAERNEANRTAMDSLGNIMALPEMTDLRKDSVQALYRKLQRDEIAVEKNFIRENPNSPVSAFTLNRNRTKWEKTSVANLFSQLKDSAKATVYGRLLDRYIRLNKNPEVGDGYVDFVQENVDGESTRLSDLMGKYTLVEFWASWCVPCRKANPELSKLYSRYRDKGLRIVGISLDEDRESWLNAIEADAMVWDNVTDLKFNENEAALVYGVVGIPDNFLIDDNGIIVARNLRERALDKKLKDVFEENPTSKQKTD
ncbi:MAG TPA: TlpA disulfide reductase family protein [Gillisia sp.]|nr:TlpA disulfide reductase family protein [Gillisia sp.]